VSWGIGRDSSCRQPKSEGLIAHEYEVDSGFLGTSQRKLRLELTPKGDGISTTNRSRSTATAHRYQLFTIFAKIRMAGGESQWRNEASQRGQLIEDVSPVELAGLPYYDSLNIHPVLPASSKGLQHDQAFSRARSQFDPRRESNQRRPLGH